MLRLRGSGMGREAIGVFLRLHLDAGERRALPPGFEDPARFAVHVEKVVGSAEAWSQLELAHDDAAGHVEIEIEIEIEVEIEVEIEIDIVVVLDDPTRRDERRIDLLAGRVFRLSHGWVGGCVREKQPSCLVAGASGSVGLAAGGRDCRCGTKKSR